MNLFYSLPLDIQQKIMMINFKIELKERYRLNIKFKDFDNNRIFDIFKAELKIIKSSFFNLEYPIINNIYVKNLNELIISYKLLKLGGDSHIYQLLKDKCLNKEYFNFFEFNFKLKTNNKNEETFLIYDDEKNILTMFNEGIENFNKFLNDFFNDKSYNKGFSTLYKNELSKLKVKNRSKCINLKERFLLLKDYYNDNYKYNIKSIDKFFKKFDIKRTYIIR